MTGLNKTDPKQQEEELFKHAGLQRLACLICGNEFDQGAYWHGTVGVDGSAGYAAFCASCIRGGRLGDFVADAMLVSTYPHYTAGAVHEAIEQTRARAWECAARRLSKSVSELEKDLIAARGGIERGASVREAE